MHQDVVKSLKTKKMEKHCDEDSSMPDRSKMHKRTTKALRQVEGVKVVNSSWVSGDAWVGSASSSVEQRKRVGAHSTFMIKSNKRFYP